ncbi:Putative sugar phosphate transporter domain-containing protein [Septoria linicola]|uniref:Sugar phosphate transporter domain-containing protein n=1 Tax=Septoria linicola TaxID=215465 RepID=A0A9Q9EMU6_9PEZI|nr:Putative sugar phosphate transporter domain-containing protein [Septoria linicola]
MNPILTTPAVVMINFLLFNQRTSRERLLAVLLSCLGVGLVSIQSFQSNLYGTVVACAAFITTACYQIWIGKKIIDLDVDAPQLLLNQSATAVCLLLPVAVVVDTFPNFATVSSRALLLLIGGGLVASFLNLSQFMIIGRTSALTFNIVSNVKMVVILSLGWYSEGKVLNALDVGGVLVAFAGAWVYAMKSS